MPVQTAEEIDFENGRLYNFEGHMACRHVALIDLYLHTEFH